MIRLGYACINTLLPSSNRTCRVANATPERIIALGRENLNNLSAILRWNREQGIGLFRISSEVVPLASHPVTAGVAWWDALAVELEQAAEIIESSGMRVSMHPGQYTVLNSPRPEVVEASIAELEYHARFLDALRAPPSAKIILHMGGVYGDKPAAMRRFAQNYARLSPSVRTRLVLENDERSYTAAAALALSGEIGAPVVLDVFHHRWNPSLEGLSLREIIARCAATWGPRDGLPKLHYSDPWPGKPPGSHSQSVNVAAFEKFFDLIRELDAAVMLEVKDKEQSVLALYREYPELRRGEENRPFLPLPKPSSGG